MAGPRIKDGHWVRQSFLVKSSDLDKIDRDNRFFSTASLQYLDTSPGGSIVINPPPQFTKYCDIRPETQRKMSSNGMGRYYHEAIHETSQVIYMRFGVPEFNSLTTFFTGFYNSQAGQLARTGRAGGLFYTLGRVTGFVVSICSWKLLAVHMLGVGYRFMTDKPSTKYYYSKPTMPLYWNAVQTIVNHIGVNKGMVPRIMEEDVNNKIGGQYQFPAADRKKFHDSLPSVFTEGGQFNVYAIANRAQRLVRAENLRLEQAINGNGVDIQAAMKSFFAKPVPEKGTADYDSYLSKWYNSDFGKEAPSSKSGNESAPDPEARKSFWDRIKVFAEAELDDGSMFASFRVNYTGSVGESFSNSVGESEISSKINGISASSRSTSFSFADGKIIDGAIGSTIGAVLGAAKDFAAGAMDSLQLSGLMSLAGAAFVDIPKHWQNSSASLPRMNYTMTLNSPYGNPMSQMMNMYIPLAMLLAAALPLSTGRHSYTSPFLVECFDKGRAQTRLGMIDSLSITRGVGNTGFTADGQCLGIEVSFSIVDLSSIMHMPISEGFSTSDIVKTAGGALLGAAGGSALAGAVGAAIGGGIGAAMGAGAFDDETPFSDYMAVLGGMGLADQVYQLNRTQLNLTRKMANFKTWYSLPHFAVWAGDTLPMRMVNAFYRGVQR